ncbi:hypothetical protein Tco_0764950 [Tanacetum coccineum]
MLTHLFFADVLLLFCNGDSIFVVVLKNAFTEFRGLSGLLPNHSKSMVFFGNVRLQLIMSVVSSMQVYWASIFILPSAIANDIERLMRDFLWNYGVFKRGKANVNWSSVCKPKVEGGLGIKSLDSWNKALMSKHIWNIITQKESLWVRWINTYRLKGRSFWDVPDKSNSFDALTVIPPPILVRDKPDVSPGLNLYGLANVSPVTLLCCGLAILGRLKTHDNMRHWDKFDNLLLKDMVKLDHAPCCWNDILKFILNRPINKSIWSILQRLVLVVRLRVLSLSLNPSAQVYEAADMWSFHVSNDPGFKRVKFVTKRKHFLLVSSVISELERPAGVISMGYSLLGRGLSFLLCGHEDGLQFQILGYLSLQEVWTWDED